MELNFYNYCKNCQGTICCTKPFYAFTTEKEREKIKNYLQSQNIPLRAEDVFQQRFSTDLISGIPYYVIAKKENGECIFLKEDKSCMIQPVKPMDCLFWPLTFEYNPHKKELTILLGYCHFTQEMNKNGVLEDWIKKESGNIVKLLKNFSKDELTAYNSLFTIPNLELVLELIID